MVIFHCSVLTFIIYDKVITYNVSASSIDEGSGDNKVLQILGKGWGLGLGPELCHNRSQQSLFETTLYSQCQLCLKVAIMVYYSD